MNEIIKPQHYDKEWWQDFMDRVERYSRKPNEYKLPRFIVVRSWEEWKYLGGPWPWPKMDKEVTDE